MEDMKKRKMDEATKGGGGGGGGGGGIELSVAATQEHLRSLLGPLNKSQLMDLLSRLGFQYPSIAEEIKSLASADPVHRKLFVRGLAGNTTSETLCAVSALLIAACAFVRHDDFPYYKVLDEAFRVHGEIEEGAVIHDKVTGKSRGYGFITYKHMESAQSALAAPSKMIDGRMAVCNLACEGLTGASTTADLAQRKLYIGGLSPEITSEMLLSVFSRHGDIEEGSVAYDKDTNESRGFGFVTYKTAEAAKKAIDDPQKILGGRTIIVKFADTRKGKTTQAQLSASMVAVPLPAAAGYAQPGNAHPGTAPVGYTYPQSAASYPASSYPSTPTAPAPYPTQSAPYPTQSQISYVQVPAKKDSLGLSPTLPVGMGGYPYYLPKQ